MKWWLLRNYFRLSKFMDIRFPIGGWVVSFKIPYDALNDKEKKLTDQFIKKAKTLI